MANKKKIFDRLENLNISNNYKNEIFNLIEDIEKENKINIGEGLKYEDDKLVVSIGTAIAAAGGNDRSGLIFDSSDRDGKNYIAINVGDGLEIDKYNKLNVTGVKIPEIIDKEIYYNDGSNKVVPVKHPDLSTQPSILPYKFMGQYVYEQLIPWSIDANAMGIIPFDLIIVQNPLFLSATLIGGYGYDVLNEPAGILKGSNSFRVKPIGTSLQGAPSDDSYLYIRIVYTSMPEENSEYYYGNNTGFFIEMTSSLPLVGAPYIYNSEVYINAELLDDGSGILWIYVPSDYTMDVYNGDVKIIFSMDGMIDYKVSNVIVDGSSLSYDYDSSMLSIQINEYWLNRAKQESINIKVFVE